MNQDLLTDQSVLEEIGARLTQRRIESGMTQAELAAAAGIGRATVERLEAGRSTQMSSFIRVLRVLGLLQDFIGLVPQPGPGPMDLLKKRPKVRRRASTRRLPGERQRTWTWSDDS